MSKFFVISRPTSFRQYLGRVAKFYAFFFLGRFIGVQLGNYVYNRQVAKAAAKAVHPSSVSKEPWGSAPAPTEYQAASFSATRHRYS